jgi:capsular exopolysaccharide synthesis family protein
MVAKTFEALQKAEKEHQIRPEEAKIFDIRPQSKPLPLNLKLPPQVVEEYQRMKHLILNVNTEKKIKTILFTSCKEGEGTSTVLRNFAITLAAGGDTVLLVDANLRHPSLHDLFNVEKRDGLTELLFGKNSLNEVINNTKINNLSIVTSGIPHSNPSSVLESALLSSATEQMKEQADWVLFDCAPINSYNDSCTLGAKLDGVMMVIQAENTRWEVAQSAKERIESDKVTLLGVVLNRRRIYIPEWAYKML